jgi:O-antigen/teichoic acid export membrane protein
MSKDLLTTLLGGIVAVVGAVYTYIGTAGDYGSPAFWLGMAVSAAIAAWGYYTNKFD